jgi:hypothetical protein
MENILLKILDGNIYGSFMLYTYRALRILMRSLINSKL